MQGVDHAGNPTQAVREWGHLPYVLIPDEVSVALEREEKESRPEIGKLNILYPLGWAKNTSGHYKKQKKDLLDKLDDLDKKAELAQILRDEEMKIFQLKDGALKKHITAYYKNQVSDIPQVSDLENSTFIKEIYPSIVLILCRDFLQIESQLNIMEGVVWIDYIMTGGHVGIKLKQMVNYFVSIFGCKKGGLRNNDWKMIEENLAMFMLSFFEDGIWQSIDTVAITSSKEIGMGTKNVGFNVIFNKECLIALTFSVGIMPLTMLKKLIAGVSTS
ncbi:hypothetical protein ACJX0J_041568 [Zea mays]